MASCLVSYRWVDLLTDAGGTDEAARLAYGYRTSSVTPTQLVLEATVRVTPGSVAAEQEAVAAIVRWRREHQPGGSNAGSVFTNPEGDSAGRLIESAGLKGFRHRHGPRVGEARQLHPGGQGRERRRRPYALMEHVRGVVGRALRGDAAHRGPPPGFRRREDWGGGGDR